MLVVYCYNTPVVTVLVVHGLQHTAYNIPVVTTLVVYCLQHLGRDNACCIQPSVQHLSRDNTCCIVPSVQHLGRDNAILPICRNNTRCALPTTSLP